MTTCVRLLYIGMVAAVELQQRLVSFHSVVRLPLLMFSSCPLQEMQQPFVKEPYGINLDALPADKDLLIYER